jgi:hypothetical protein
LSNEVVVKRTPLLNHAAAVGMKFTESDEAFAALRAALQAYADSQGMSFAAAMDLFGNGALHVVAHDDDVRLEHCLTQ